MKKKLFALIVTSFLASSALATETDQLSQIGKPKLEFEGLFHFQTGILSQKHLKAEEKFISPEKKHFAFSTEGGMKVIYSHEMDDFTYGAQLVFTPTSQITTSGGFNGSHIFVTTEHGRFEAGSPRDAGSNMRITGGDCSAGSGDWDSYAKLDTTKVKYNDLSPEFATSNQYFISSYKTELLQPHDKTEFARKISFYTPSLNGFEFGVSYIPDSRNIGGAPFDKEGRTGIKKYKIAGTNNTMVVNSNVKDAVSFGLAYSYNIKDGVDLKLAGTGEVAKASGNAELIENEEDKENKKVLNKYTIKSLRTYNIGGTISYGNLSYALSYGTLNKSLTAKEFNKTGRETRYYNGGVAYGQGPFKTSLEYFKSVQFKNNLDAVTLGTEFKAAPGLLPYAEVTHFKGKGRPSFYPEASKKKLNGNVFILGTKLRLKL